jgi:predicted glycoside hydrolase/deacetylase ChbG (UPF0249 family)
VVNADDLGLAEPVNAGIVAAHVRGIVTAASLIAVGPAFGDALRWCRAMPSLDIGVHLTAVGGCPLLGRGSGLAGATGRFPDDHGSFVREWLSGRIRPTDVQAEWAAQIERVLQQGLRVTHLDSHQHIHALPGLAERTFALADRYRIPFVRVPVERHPPPPEGPRGLGRMLSGLVLRGAWTTARLAGRGRVRGGLRFLGFAEGGRLDLVRLKRLLARLRPGAAYELMCHPGFTPEAPEVRRWHYRHADELLALTHPAVRELVESRGIRLCRFTDLAEMQ